MRRERDITGCSTRAVEPQSCTCQSSVAGWCTLPLFTAATAIIGGAVIGGSTNAINAVVSPLYFRTIMQWQDVENIWRSSVAQGIFEGLLYGIVVAVVFTLVVGLVSRERCPVQISVPTDARDDPGYLCLLGDRWPDGHGTRDVES